MEKEYRFVSLENCEKIDEGKRSEIFALDEEKVVKVFHDDFTPEMVENCYQKALEYMRLGLPVQKAYELVKTEKGYGIVYDYIRGGSLGKYLHAHPDRIEPVAKSFAALFRQIHQNEVEPDGAFPDCKKSFKDNLDTLSAYFSKYDIKSMKQIIDALPDGRCLLHSDWHAQNVMLADGEELVIIDTDDSTYGHPFLDMGGFRLMIDTVDSHPENAMIIHGMEPEEVKRMWAAFLPAYFQTADKDYLDKLQQACFYFGQLRMAQMLNNNVELKPAEKKILVQYVRLKLIIKKSKVCKLFSSIRFPGE